MNVMEVLQSKLQEEVESLQGLQKQQAKAVSTRQTLDSQLSENQMVADEMARLKDSDRVFKLIGPAMVRQDVGEAKANVDKRIKYIGEELKRTDGVIKGLEKKQEEHRDNLNNMQAQMQKLAQA